MKMITLRTTCIAVMAAAMLAGCSKSEPQPLPETPAATDGTIRAVARVENSIEVDTKAPNDATSADGLKVFVVAFNNHLTNILAQGTMTFKTGTTKDDAVTFDAGFTGTNLLPLDNTEVSTCALYPSTGWELANGNRQIEFAFTGCEDIMFSNDLIARKSENRLDFATFNMGHWLTRFDITAKAADAAAQAAWGRIKSIVFKKGDDSVFDDTFVQPDDDGYIINCKNNLTQWPSYQITKSAGNTVYTDTKFAATDFAGASALTTTATPICYTIMADFAVTEATNEIVLEITTLDKSGGADVVTTVDLDIDHVAVPNGTTGVQFAVNLTFKTKQINATATIVPWSTPVVIDKEID